MAVAYVIVIVLMLTISSSITVSATDCHESIISFGDSLADTGNLVMLCRTEKQPCSVRSPYGQNFFHHPAGRACDGRLIIDFIAESLGLPLVQPYLGGDSRSFRKGVNFAVGGATALDRSFFEERGIHNLATNMSLRTQLDWFKQFLATLPDGKKILQSSLVLVGEIGGNDYNFPLMQGINKELIRSFAPKVVGCIGSTIKKLIKLGVETMLVPGIPPIGCMPLFLTQYATSNEKDYHPITGCLNWLNEFPEYHNKLLQQELSRIRKLHPKVTIVYADYYNATLRFYLSPKEFGFTKGILRACCGAGGPYNFNISAMCGTLPAVSCDDPSSCASWDGLHFTEAAYRVIAQGLLEGPYTTPQIKTVCPSISRLQPPWSLKLLKKL
ncbi:hypothetical protein BUALT_Bualt03G0048300 [Buddleja alternifolia]|uniref:Uncharacterized protein n=1 Tax=Buddleja alternifolia TaxID=168488 RepID=A0AAV6XXW1_9LAMI|nr:hypothetical protein BUALT_Bualt03G0048300 [Buddleja alternifolia]